MTNLETCDCCGETIGLSQAIVGEGRILCGRCAGVATKCRLCGALTDPVKAIVGSDGATICPSCVWGMALDTRVVRT